MKIRIIIAFVAFFTTVNAFATGWYQNTEIKGIYLLDTQRAIVKLSTVSTANKCNVDASGDVFLFPAQIKNGIAHC